MIKLSGKKGLTLVEVVVSLAIFAAIALPLLSVFGQSIKTDRAASDVLNANYISQDYIEKLHAATYTDALNNLPNKKSVNGFYLSASIEPYGTANSLFSGQCSYVHIVMFSDGTMLAVMPDGKYKLFSSIPSTVSLILNGSTYTFAGGSTNLTGTSSYGYCCMIVNAMNKPGDKLMKVSFVATNCKSVVYCADGHTGDITVSPSSSGNKFENIIKGDVSLIHVTASVFVLGSDSKPISSSESYINIKNW